jgi:hypothetical protein
MFEKASVVTSRLMQSRQDQQRLGCGSRCSCERSQEIAGVPQFWIHGAGVRLLYVPDVNFQRGEIRSCCSDCDSDEARQRCLIARQHLIKRGKAVMLPNSCRRCSQDQQRDSRNQSQSDLTLAGIAQSQVHCQGRDVKERLFMLPTARMQGGLGSDFVSPARQSAAASA